MSDAMWDPQDVDRKVTLKGWAKHVLEQCERQLRRERQAGRKAVGLVVVLVLVALGFIVSMALGQGWISFGIFVVCGAIAIAIHRLRRAGVDHRKLEVVSTLVSRMEHELKPGELIEATVDFRGYGYYAEQIWLTLNMTLLDGSRVTLTASTVCYHEDAWNQRMKKSLFSETFVVRTSPPSGHELVPMEPEVPELSLGVLLLRAVEITRDAATFEFSTREIVRGRVKVGEDGNGCGVYEWAPMPLDTIPQGRDAVRAVSASMELLGRMQAASVGSGEPPADAPEPERAPA